MSQSVVLKAKGLSVHSNPLGAVAEGSMQEALNVVIDRNEVIEPRRGFFEYGTSFGIGSDRAKNLFNYKDVILRHVTNVLQYDSDNLGLFANFVSDKPVTEIQPGLRIKSIESNGNFYFVSSLGVRKISARTQTDLLTAAITLAGGIKALNINAKANFTSTGFLSPNAKVAYRVVFGIKDLNENLILGSPSAREVVYNITGNSCVVDLNFPLPDEANSTNVIYQVYRTSVFAEVPPTEPPDPGDEMYLVFEDNLTPAQITAGEVNVTDITPEDFRKNGTLLYTNPQSGDGIEQANEKPPFGTDIADYKGYTFLANTKTVQRANLSFLSIQGLVDNVSTFGITDGVTLNTYTFQGSFETFTADFTGTVHADYVNVAPATAKYFTLISASDERKYCIYFVESVNDEVPVLAGYIMVPVAIINTDTIDDIIDKTILAINTETDDFNLTKTVQTIVSECSNNGYVLTAPTTNIVAPFSVSKDGLGTGEDAANNKIFLPKVPGPTENGPTTAEQLEQVAKSLQRVVNEKDTLVYAYYNSGYNDVPGQLLFENRDIVGNPFSFISSDGNQFNPTLPSSISSGNQVTSNNEVRPNRVHYSKFQQPEAFPLLNYIDIGPKDREIKRIIALRDSLFIFKEEGIYRLSGDTAPFTVAPFDFSAQVLAADTAVVLNNQIYALSIQGVVVVTDTGVEVVSRPIENLLLNILRPQYAFRTASFGVSYESERSYLLWVPTNPIDTVATQCFRYNTFTRTWTRWDNTKTCGLVNFANDRLYLGAGDINIIEKERKSLTRIDHADREYDLEVVLNGVNENVMFLNNISKVQEGDVLIQHQHLTMTQFNRMLIKMDSDIQIVDNDYYATLKFTPGKNFRSSLVSLAQKMDNDPGLQFNNYLSLISGQTATITNIMPNGSETIITTSAPHNLTPGRYISITGTDSIPNIDGDYSIISTPSPTTLVIGKVIAYSGTTGFLQTNLQSFEDIQACFNLIVNQLNSDNGAFYSNYDTSNDIVEMEAIVVLVNKNNNSVVLSTTLPYSFGQITLYKSFQTRVIWNPTYFGDPTLDKQVREGTLMFQNTNFSKVSISYSSDQSPSFEETIFGGMGVGDWGQFNWSEVNWGGVAAPIPLRTYIPLEKQRCRFINVKFDHKVAFEKYAIFGMSLTFRPYNIRTNR